MYRRIIVVVAAALFVLQAILAVVITDLFDRQYPVSLRTTGELVLDFSKSTFTGDQGFDRLLQLNEADDLGLVKIAPDLSDTGAQVFVPLAGDVNVDGARWFAPGRAVKMLSVGRLAHSDPDGTYLITHRNGNIASAARNLSEAGVVVKTTTASAVGQLAFALRDARFGAPLIATFALLSATALFWLAMRSRGRALRVLAGTPRTWIVSQDLAAFFKRITGSALGVAAASAAAIGIARGWVYVPPFLSIFAVLSISTLVVSALVLVALSVVAWPDIDILANRKVAVKSLRRTAAVIQAAIFVLLVASAGPTWTAFTDASQRARELAAWNQLSDQVSLVFAMPQADLVKVEPIVGHVVSDAEEDDSIALSYTFDASTWDGDLGGYSGVSFVNTRWISLMTKASEGSPLESAESSSSRRMLNRELLPTLDLFADRKGEAQSVLEQSTLLQPKKDAVFPVAVGGSRGALKFLHNILVVEVPRVSDFLNHSNETSMASTGNLLFTGVQKTQAKLAANGGSLNSLAKSGVQGSIQTIYVAESGILTAQYSTYVVWLLALSLAALVVAFCVSAGVNALIVALIRARRDFPLRLAGQSWMEVLSGRTTRALGVGAALLAVVLVVQKPSAPYATLAVAVFALAAVLVGNVGAARYSFSKIVCRKI